MGQRANLIIIEAQNYQLFYSHWCANTIPRDLFWGPDHALRFIRIQREVEKTDWLDTVWAEGGAVVDLDQRNLLLFGGEDIRYDVPLRRAYLDLLRTVWKGWEVRWAHEGIADLADRVGYPRSNVISTKDDEPISVLSPPKEREWIDIVASIRFEDESIRLYPLAGNVEEYLACGPDLLKTAEVGSGLDRLTLSEWTTSFPTGGLHLDSIKMRVDFWKAADAPGILDGIGHR